MPTAAWRAQERGRAAHKQAFVHGGEISSSEIFAIIRDREDCPDRHNAHNLAKAGCLACNELVASPQHVLFADCSRSLRFEPQKSPANIVIKAHCGMQA
jgi:hypothetical protein